MSLVSKNLKNKMKENGAKDPKIIVMDSLYGIGISDEFVKKMNEGVNMEIKNIKVEKESFEERCDKCKDTSCLAQITFKYNDNHYICRLRYDFDDTDRKEMDIQVVRSNKTGDWCEWTYSAKLNYCPFCGYQHWENEEQKSNVLIDKSYKVDDDIISAKLRYERNIKSLILELSVSNQKKDINVSTQREIGILYNINTGKRL